jgi:uncharacterized protein YdaU (DUF1376 family)
MAKLPWMQFYPADYLLDTQLLSPASRGIWMDLICHLWRAETRGTMTLSREHWARLLRCTVKEATHALDELLSHGICNAVTLGNDDVTLSSRRLVREEKRRRGAAMRVSRHREKRECNAPVTGENQKSESEVIYQNQNQNQNQISEEEREEKKDKKEKSCGQVKTLPAPAAKSSATWEAYAGAYRRRYGVEPVRNSKTNAQLCQLVDRLGAEEAPQVAAFFLTHNKPLYVAARHPTNLLVQDAEGLRTQWATGVKATTGEAKNLELRDNVVGQYERVMASLERKGML